MTERKFVQVVHHGRKVFAMAELQGKHREHCLCYACDKMRPGQPDHCRIAAHLYSFCVLIGMTTPVYECPEFKPRRTEKMKATRTEVYAVIDAERDYQDAGRGNAKRHDGMPPMTPGEYILCMEKLLADARTIWYAPDGGVKCLDAVRKVSALGVACMELHGAPKRE